MKPPANTARAVVCPSVLPKQILRVSKKPLEQEWRPDAEKSAPAAKLVNLVGTETNSPSQQKAA